MKILLRFTTTLAFILLCFTTSCTFNVSMAHTEGAASDVIDDTATNTPNVSPTVNIPLTPTL